MSERPTICPTCGGNAVMLDEECLVAENGLRAEPASVSACGMCAKRGTCLAFTANRRGCFEETSCDAS